MKNIFKILWAYRDRAILLSISALILAAIGFRAKADYQPVHPQAPGLSGIFRSAHTDKNLPNSKAAPEETVRAALEVHYTGNPEEDRAIDLVKNRPDVAEWYADTEKPSESSYVRSKPIIDVSHRTKDGKIVVHAYDLVRDDFIAEVTGDPSMNAHTATMDWFTVDSATGEVVSEFEKNKAATD